VNAMTTKVPQLFRRFLGLPNDTESGGGGVNVAAERPDDRRVLFVLDRGATPEAAVTSFLASFSGQGHVLVVLRVVPDWCLKEMESSSADRLQRAAARLSSARCRVIAEVRRGEPVEEILGAAHEHAADLIVVPARRGSFSHRVDESVVTAVRRQSRIPVLVAQTSRVEAASRC